MMDLLHCALLVFLLVVVLQFSVTPAAAVVYDNIQCYDEANRPVDWWIILKYPDGSRYSYVDSDTTSLGLKRSPHLLSDSTVGALSYTLDGIYDPKWESGYVMYNDEWPDQHKHGTGGHTKGVFGWSTDNYQDGFWLIHSVPRFPSFVKDGYDGLPEEEFRYGQSMMCISLGYKQLEAAAKQIITGHPWVFDYKLLEGQDDDALPNMKALAEGQKSEDWDINKEIITSLKGAIFTSFYKSPNWGQYLYEDYVEPYYQSSMFWETWMNGINPDPTFCKPDYDYNSINIRTLGTEDGEESWKETQDHSKWGVSSNDSTTKVVCIGDINRQESQNKRGGGTTCIVSDDLQATFIGLVQSADPCD